MTEFDDLDRIERDMFRSISTGEALEGGALEEALLTLANSQQDEIRWLSEKVDELQGFVDGYAGDLDHCEDKLDDLHASYLRIYNERNRLRAELRSWEEWWAYVRL